MPPFFFSSSSSFLPPSFLPLSSPIVVSAAVVSTVVVPRRRRHFFRYRFYRRPPLFPSSRVPPPLPAPPPRARAPPTHEVRALQRLARGFIECTRARKRALMLLWKTLEREDAKALRMHYESIRALHDDGASRTAATPANWCVSASSSSVARRAE